MWSYAGSLVGPIFTFGAVSGQVAQAEAAQNAALLNYQLSIRNAFADVDNALIANQKLQEQLDAQVKLVAALQQYNELARLQYDGGYTSYSTVLQAEQALFPAELNLASIRAQVFASAVNIYKAMGGGWVDAGRPADRQHAGARRRSARCRRRCSSAALQDPLRWQLTPSSLHTLRMRVDDGRGGRRRHARVRGRHHQLRQVVAQHVDLDAADLPPVGELHRAPRRVGARDAALRCSCRACASRCRRPCRAAPRR